MKSNGARPKALIIGFDEHGLALARSLGRRGLLVKAIDAVPNPRCRHSRFCHQFEQVSSLEDQSVVDYLLEDGRKHVDRRVLFITRDKTVPVISEARELLSQYYYFTLPDRSCIHQLMDKGHLSVFLSRAKANTPLTMLVEDSHELTLVAENIGFPCILKPATRTYGFKAYKTDSLPELREAYSRTRQHTDRVIAQEWVEGNSGSVYFCFVYINKTGHLVSHFVGHKLRQLPVSTGIASASRGCNAPSILSETARLMAIANYRGFGSAEFKKDSRTGEFKFIEFTVGRTDFNVETAMSNNVDLPHIGYCDAVGLLQTCEPVEQGIKRCWIDFGRDTQAIWDEYRSGRYGVIRMLNNYLRNLSPWNVYSLFSIDDPSPAVRYAVGRVKAGFRKLWRTVAPSS